MTVNLGNNTIGIARDEIQAAIKHIGWDRIRALERESGPIHGVFAALIGRAFIEVGNEADQYVGNLRPSGWSSFDYTAQYLVPSDCVARSTLKLKPIFDRAGPRS